MTSFQKVMPVLRMADLDRAVGWYTRVLGFAVCWRALALAGFAERQRL